MANTPLYKFLKNNGTTVYVFPGAAEDISAAYQNENYKMYFSKFALLNFPDASEKIKDGTSDNDDEEKSLYYNFDVFKTSSQYTNIDTTTQEGFGNAIVESLRNYVANQEVVIKESKLNNTEYFYNNRSLDTNTERIFWKWAKKLNLISFEPAIPQDEYYSNLKEFERNNITDDEYFEEYLWKEREVEDYDVIGLSYSISPKELWIEFSSPTNFQKDDYINVYNLIEGGSSSNTIDIGTMSTEEGINFIILDVIDNLVKVEYDDISGNGSSIIEGGNVRLNYNRFVQYIGEIMGVNNVQENNRNYTEVQANVPDHTGQTPDILFRTIATENYPTGTSFPIIPSQYQPEIMGAENYNSPIVNNPQNYPGSYFGQFDTQDFTYATSNGDPLRRSGNFYGVDGNINNTIISGANIDGIIMDFNTSHYVKMNIPNRRVTNFDSFNALKINNEPPKDFEFNAILWYYTVEDNHGNNFTNLYGITFMDNPVNNTTKKEVNGILEKEITFPKIKKLVVNGNQDGTSYGFNLNLNFNIINENPVETYNPQAINSITNMGLFNRAMSRLSSTNDSFINLLAEQMELKENINALRGLLYTQTDINTLNAKITNLEDLLKLYQSNQLVDSNSILVESIPGNPPMITLSNIDTPYENIHNIKTKNLYDDLTQTIIPMNIPVTRNRNFMLNVINDDDVAMNINDNSNLIIVLDNDLSLNQSVDIHIDGDIESTENKRLDIYMISDAESLNGDKSEILLIGDIDLPVYYNIGSDKLNSAYISDEFNFNIDFATQSIEIVNHDTIKIKFNDNELILENSIEQGDVLKLNNFFVDIDQSGSQPAVMDYSGQYEVISTNNLLTDKEIIIDVSNNHKLIDDIDPNTYSDPFVIHYDLINNKTRLHNKPYFTLNKGVKIKITRVSNSNILKERYHIYVSNNNS